MPIPNFTQHFTHYTL